MDEGERLGEVLAAVEDSNLPPLTLQRFQPEEESEALSDFAAIVDLWRERRGGAAVPDWNDMDFSDFRGWHAQLMLSKFETDEPDPTFRLAGERVTELLGFPMQNHRFSELAPRFYALQFRDHFREIRNEGLIGLTSGKLPAKGRAHIFLRILELPFRDGGDKVERILHVLSKAVA
ncbi:PAS domain-containing protein [Pelagibius sp. CAU 1746]|uniref:PAS domain-containing protein n=1 Tax=Pelagibius sp. CAU 1746 TaxID=3140370 RepID=UPI00325C173D